MKKRGLLVLVLLIAIVASSSLFAASTFNLGSVNYYSYYDLEDENFEEFIPGLRAEFFLSDFLGVSADMLITDSVPDYEYYELLYIFDVVVRFPLGLVEPYIATGPAYRSIIWGDYSETDEEAFAYNIRAGVDFNILDFLSLGIETNFIVEDVPEFFDAISDYTSEQMADLVKGYSKIGISAKVKF